MEPCAGGDEDGAPVRSLGTCTSDRELVDSAMTTIVQSYSALSDTGKETANAVIARLYESTAPPTEDVSLASSLFDMGLPTHREGVHAAFNRRFRAWFVAKKRKESGEKYEVAFGTLLAIQDLEYILSFLQVLAGSTLSTCREKGGGDLSRG